MNRKDFLNNLINEFKFIATTDFDSKEEIVDYGTYTLTLANFGYLINKCKYDAAYQELLKLVYEYNCNCSNESATVLYKILKKLIIKLYEEEKGKQ